MVRHGHGYKGVQTRFRCCQRQAHWGRPAPASLPAGTAPTSAAPAPALLLRLRLCHLIRGGHSYHRQLLYLNLHIMIWKPVHGRLWPMSVKEQSAEFFKPFHYDNSSPVPMARDGACWPTALDLQPGIHTDWRNIKAADLQPNGNQGWANVLHHLFVLQ